MVVAEVEVQGEAEVEAAERRLPVQEQLEEIRKRLVEEVVPVLWRLMRRELLAVALRARAVARFGAVAVVEVRRTAAAHTQVVEAPTGVLEVPELDLRVTLPPEASPAVGVVVQRQAIPVQAATVNAA
jgi:hypothetical protein